LSRISFKRAGNALSIYCGFIKSRTAYNQSSFTGTGESGFGFTYLGP